jgi:lipoprotein-releasing system permease protein
VLGWLDARVGYELFVSRRHLAIFRLRFLAQVAAVLLLGVLPPLLLLALLRTCQAAVERTRIRQLGLQDPLAAAEALHRLKLREQSPTVMMTALSVGGVGVGVMALILVMAVMGGFEAELKSLTLGTQAHVLVTSRFGVITREEGLAERILQVPGVTAATPFVYSEVMLASSGDATGAIVRGVEPGTVAAESALKRGLEPADALALLSDPGRLAPGEGGRPPLPAIIVGSALADGLGVKAGDVLSVVSPLAGGMGPNGPVPKSGAFRVAGVFHSGMAEYDARSAYLLLSEAQRFFDVQGVHGVELKVADVEQARQVAGSVVRALGPSLYVARDWAMMNHNLFAALAMQKQVMGLILGLISVVAAGLIVATVIMLVLEKRKDISVLKALGVPDRGVLRIFVAQGVLLGASGGLLGLASGWAWCHVLERVGVRLDADVYFISRLPVYMQWPEALLAVAAAVLISFLASVYPARKASRLEPVEGLKGE